MSLLLSCQAISKAYGTAPLFEQLSFGLFEGDRVGLVGPNGSGKSTLLKILAGIETPDSGTRAVRKLLRLGYVPQDATFPPDQGIEDIVTAALPDDLVDADERHTRVSIALAKVGFPDPRQRAATLSGGWTKRLAVACALVRAPDLLLMDEPTNHLDVDGILWLEKLLRAEALAYLVVSHDRYFLENVANRIIELNRCYATGVLDTRGTYSDFLEKKDEALRGQESYRATLANRVRGELEWLKRGPKARTRKSGARIQDAALLQAELATVTSRTSTRAVRIEFNASDRKTKRLLVAEQIAKRFASQTIIEGLSLTLSPGMRLGILGPNGSGKTTLLRLLAGDESVDSGTIERADGLRIVYLDQHREQIDDTLTLRRALAPHGDQVIYNDRPLHVATWAKRFLFPSEQLDMPVGRLSGGERARVSIAQLMLRPADVLMLDEPTNDLDIPTLEVLEESLLEFGGAIVLVTHDRFLFDRVSTVVLALDGTGRAEVFADFQQWQDAQRGQVTVERPAAASPVAKPAPSGVKRLSYTERREWVAMEATILAAEQALEACHAATSDPSVAADAAVLHQRYTMLREAQEHVDRLYARWAELEAKQTQ
ncbi:MAG: ABC-F family ATP-binding cassette domain-containing protein [Deltaproteobacteria bacterium]|nr:ABC-F family ATP-binding cassette domain-containing protein [Deltaproteobacteria bacterium]MBI3387113.1 ABC-F family ATP-binding cassette domain-containing protein [Deltaproteobacteria bacterium]